MPWPMATGWTVKKSMGCQTERHAHGQKAALQVQLLGALQHKLLLVLQEEVDQQVVVHHVLLLLQPPQQLEI